MKGIIIDLVRLDDYMLYFIKKSYRHSSKIRLLIMAKTSNNQRLRSAADNDGRTKRFYSNAVLCVVSRYGWSTRKIKLRVREGPNAHDQIAFYAFHSFFGKSKRYATHA